MVTKPTPGGDADTWGQILNTALDELNDLAESKMDPGVLTTRGDLITATGPSSPARLPAGTAGQFLTTDPADATLGLRWTDLPAPTAYRTVPTAADRPAPTAGAVIFTTDTNRLWIGRTIAGTNYWTPPPGTCVFQAARATAQAYAGDGTNAALEFDTEHIDLYDTFTAPSTRFQPNVPGLYLIYGGYGFVGNTAGSRTANLYRNGSSILGCTAYLPPNGASPAVYPTKTVPVTLNGTTDYVEMSLSQTSGTTLNTLTGFNFRPYLAALYLGPS